MRDLTCYRIRDDIGTQTNEFDELVELSGRAVSSHGPVEREGFSAKLYVTQMTMPRPTWADLFEGVFTPEADFAGPRSISALLLVRLANPTRYFAFAFGYAGRHLIKTEVIDRDYGVRAAINLTLTGEANLADAQSRVRSLDFKRVAHVTTRTRRQTSRDVTLDDFDVDRTRDIVSKVTARPADVESWGVRISGGDALIAGVDVDFDGLADYCRRLDDASSSVAFRERYPWIDQLRPVRDKVRLDEVREAIVEALQDPEDSQAFELTPPEIVDWDRVARFQYHYDRRSHVLRPILALQHYLANAEVQAELGYDFLNKRQIFAVNSDGHDVHKWTVWRCMSGTLESDGVTYVLDDGGIYEVAKELLDDLNARIDAIPIADIDLPDCDSGVKECDYNTDAANSLESLLLLDRKTVRPAPTEHGIEVCDLLSTDRQLIHVKRHFASSTLSHLFAQGLVSAEALVKRRYLREQAVELIDAQNSAPHEGLVVVDEYHAADFEVVYAIIGPWDGKSLAQRLPFFSKMMLRHVADELTTMGYRVAHRRINETPV